METETKTQDAAKQAEAERAAEREHEKAADDYALGASDHAYEAAGDR